MNVTSTLVGITPFSHVNVCKQQNQMLLLILNIAFLQPWDRTWHYKDMFINTKVHNVLPKKKH